MFSKKSYRDVVEMVRDAGVDPSFADDLEKHIAGCQLVRRLFVLRCVRGLTQKDVAEKMGCTQGRISKLEASCDDDLRLGDIRRYAEALGLTAFLGLEGGPSAMARVKFHHDCIRREVDALAKRAVKDERVAEGIARFFDQAAFDFLKVLEDATKSLPAEAQPRGAGVQIVGPEEDACRVEATEADGSNTVSLKQTPRPGRFVELE